MQVERRIVARHINYVSRLLDYPAKRTGDLQDTNVHGNGNYAPEIHPRLR